MRLATMFLLFALTASAQQVWTPANFYGYMPSWFAYRLGQAIDTDLFMICIAPATMSPAPMYFAELSWEAPAGRRQSVSFMAYPDPERPQTCKSFRLPPVTADGEGLKHVSFSVTPLIQAGEAFVQGPIQIR